MKGKTPNAQRPTSNAQRKRPSELDVERSALGVERFLQPIAWLAPTRSGKQDFSLHEAKNVTIKRLPRLAKLLHLVCPDGQPRYYLLLTGIHRFLAPLFTSIPKLFETSTLPYRHDSTQTWNPARLAE